MAEGALPIATRLTFQPLASVNKDQSPPGSPTPISAKLTVPPAARAVAEMNGQAPAIAAEAMPTLMRSRRVRVNNELIPKSPCDAPMGVLRSAAARHFLAGMPRPQICERFLSIGRN